MKLTEVEIGHFVLLSCPRAVTAKEFPRNSGDILLILEIGM
jgi:hypothetical protein